MARRLNRLVSIVLSSALVVCSVGLDAQQAAAQTLTGRVVPVSSMPQIGLGILSAPAPSMALPVLSLAALWLLPVPGASAKFTTDPTLTLSVAVAAFLSGTLCWWRGFHRNSRILGTGASVGLGTAFICLLANPVAWVFSLATFFLWPVVSVALLILGGVVLELAFRLFTKVWPNLAFKRDAAKARRPLT